MAQDTLDSTDWKILSILQGNAAIPNIELAEKVFLSPSPCSRRVKNLEEKGYINKRVTLLDPNKVASSDRVHSGYTRPSS
jgi:Lrp/AsnC family transcriptional regulator, leucine-responsive regulatory protein